MEKKGINDERGKRENIGKKGEKERGKRENIGKEGEKRGRGKIQGRRGK